MKRNAGILTKYVAKIIAERWIRENINNKSNYAKVKTKKRKQ